MSNAPDTLPERIAEYGRLFALLKGRDRTATGIRFRFRADPGLETWVRDIAKREKDCCGFFDFEITVSDREIWWDAQVIDDDMARQFLEVFYGLPDVLAQKADAAS
jgi:hypothetical protein